jgi:preprotein translocase subunit SecA
MLETEVETRVQAALADEEGPWRLIAWLEGVQPPFESRGRLMPTFGLSLMLDELRESTDARHSMADLVSRAIETEHGRAERAIEALIDRTQEGLQARSRREDALDAFFEPRDSENPCGRQRPRRVGVMPATATSTGSCQLGDGKAHSRSKMQTSGNTSWRSA